MEALILFAASAMNIVCFIIGAKVGQTVSKGEDIKLPEFDPMKPIRERQDRKQAEAEQERYETILHNVENYDGTGANQKDVPRG
jgi:hypothetical protein